MTKYEFLFALHKKLEGLPEAEAEDRLRFYIEMIEDRMESGLSEEEAVAAAGSVEEIAAQIAGDISPAPPEPEPVESEKPKRKAGESLLLAMGSPLWLPLLIAAFAAGISLYISLWAIIVSLWAAFGSFVACGVAGILGGIVIAFAANGTAGLALIAAGSICTGLAIFAFLGCKAVTTGTTLLTKKCALWLKGRFSRKEDATC